MAKISDTTRRFVGEQLSQATAVMSAARQSVPAGPMDFERALRVLSECDAAIRGTDDIDAIATHLRAASRALEHFCSGPEEACVSSAIRLLDRAIQGETF